jgi:diguanylate cyclase
MRTGYWRNQNDRVIVGWADRGLTASAAVIALLLTLSWAGSYAAGGSHTVLPHLFYLPIIVAAARFGHRGALCVSLLAGLAAGPLLPLNVAAQQAQAAPNWLGRLAAFLVIGQVTAALHSRSLTLAREHLQDRATRAALREGLDRNEFVPVYQAVIDLEHDRVVGFEALARWQQPDGELLGPHHFIPGAERTGMVHELGLRILEQACNQLAEWTRHPAHRSLRMAVNLSPRQLDDTDLASRIEHIIHRSGIDPTSLVLEVTETALASDPQGAARSLHALRALGIRIALDDFGVGQSSLSVLHEFPIDIVKIDRSFIAAMSSNSKVGAMIEAIVALTKALGIELPIAEGIETHAQLHAVAALGCGTAQGFLLARPMPAESARSHLEICHHQEVPSSPASGLA